MELKGTIYNIMSTFQSGELLIPVVAFSTTFSIRGWCCHCQTMSIEVKQSWLLSGKERRYDNGFQQPFLFNKKRLIG